jgi:hypothetical protein
VDDELFRLMAEILGCERRFRYFNVEMPFCKVHGGTVWPCPEASMAAVRIESSEWLRDG